MKISALEKNGTLLAEPQAVYLANIRHFSSSDNTSPHWDIVAVSGTGVLLCAGGIIDATKYREVLEENLLQIVT